MSKESFAKIVGEENVLSKSIDKEVYAADASQVEGKANIIVLPETIEQVHKVVRYAIRTNANIVIRGGGSGLAGGAVPQDSIVLDLSKLNKIVEINKKENYAIVEAGVILDDLNYELEPELVFPIRPSSHSICTIGGMIATNAAGNNAIKYGKVCKWVDELEIIDGTGKLFKIKRQDINNFCGREGVTGIVVKAKLNLKKPSDKKSMELLKFGDIKKLIESVNKFKENKNVAGIEFFNDVAAELAQIEPKHHLIVEFESDEGSIKDAKNIEKLWDLREGMGPVSSSAGFIIMEDPKIPEERIIEFLDWIEANKLPCFGHIGLGIFHPRFKTSQKDLIKKMFKFVKEIDGEVSGEHGIGLNKKEYVSKEVVDEIKALKKEYDPNNLINRGKII